MKRAMLLCLTALMLVTLVACNPPTPQINTEPVSDGTVTIPVGKPTEPAPGTPLTLSELLGEMGSIMLWSDMKNYEHTEQDAHTAVFNVNDGEGHDATLLIVFDAESDVISQATLSYEDVSINILTDDTMIIREIMMAMDEG